MRVVCFALCAVVAACGDDAPPPQPAAALTEVALVPATAGSDVDVLFVINDTNGAGEYSYSLANAFPELVQALGARAAGLPNLHVGVVTSDLGTSSVDDAPAPQVAGCSGTGEGGALRTAQGMTDPYLSDVAGPDGSRVTNFTGTISDGFTALAAVGTIGCPFDQPVAAALRALSGTPANTGFRRPDAPLAVVFVGDEDDCSMLHGGLMTMDTSVVGPLQLFRCARYGVTCEFGGLTPDDMNTPGPKLDCRSNDHSPYLTSMADSAAALKSLAPDPRDVLVAAIAGDPTPVTVELRRPTPDAAAIPAVAASCTYETSDGALAAAGPAVRLADLLGRFRHHVFASLCTQDFRPALDAIALQLGNLLGDPCIPVTVRQPTTCTAADEPPGGAAPVPLPACDGATPTDCFSLVTDQATCPLGDHLALHVARSEPPAPGTMTSLRCSP